MEDIHGPGEPIHFEFSKQNGDALPQFVSEEKLARGQIRAGLTDGSLVPWRKDAAGFQWYRRADAGAASLAPIHGIPAEQAQ